MLGDMDGLLHNRGAVVVGGSRGVGRAVAELLAGLGTGVVVNGRGEDAVSETVTAITGAGHAAVGFAGSPADEATAEALMVTCEAHFDRVDILVNCAGIAEPPESSILTVTGAQFDALMASHLGTAFFCCRAAAPATRLATGADYEDQIHTLHRRGLLDDVSPPRVRWRPHHRSMWRRCMPTWSETSPPWSLSELHAMVSPTT